MGTLPYGGARPWFRGPARICGSLAGPLLFELKDKGDPARADVCHVVGVLCVLTEKTLLDEAFDKHPENGNREERGIARAVDPQRSGQITQHQSGVNGMPHVAVRPCGHNFSL